MSHSPTFSRRQTGHSGSSIPEQSQPSAHSSTFAASFGEVGVSSCVRALTATLIAAVPRTLRVASLRADVMQGKAKPVEHVMRLMLAAIDSGTPAAEAGQWMQDAAAFLREYEGRKSRRQTAGILPFHQLHTRVAISETREDCEADSARMLVDEDCIASLETARKERMDAVEAAEREVELLTHRIAHLRSQGR